MTPKHEHIIRTLPEGYHQIMARAVLAGWEIKPCANRKQALFWAWHPVYGNTGPQEFKLPELLNRLATYVRPNE